MENISKKEFLISAIVVLLALALAIFLNPFIADSMTDNVREYEKALKIDSPTQFVYAKQTSIGNVLAYGEFSSVGSVGLPELSGSYPMIERITERYTMHTRLVCAGYDKKGNCTSWRTEVYYTWDTHNRENFFVNTFSFLGVEFPVASLNLEPVVKLGLSKDTVSSGFLKKAHGNYLYEDDSLFVSVGDLRYYYKVLPPRFMGSMFVRFSENKVSNPSSPKEKIAIHYGFTPEQVIQELRASITRFNIIYYSVWIVLIAGAYFFWAYNIGEVE